MTNDATQTKPPSPEPEKELHAEIKQRLPRWCSIVLDIEHKLDNQAREKRKP